MKIEIFGPGCPKCNTLENEVKSVIAELNIAADVQKIKDIGEMVKRGILMTPALFIDGKKMSEGKVPSKEQLKQWLGGK